MNKKIGIIFIGVALIIGGVGYFMWSQKGGQEIQNGAVPSGALDTIQNTQPAGEIPGDAAHTQPVSGKVAAEPEMHTITIQNFAFDPAELHVKKGDVVMWINRDSVPHRIVGSNFNSEILSGGKDFTFTFVDTGTFDYICGIHPSMKGKIVVE